MFDQLTCATLEELEWYHPSASRHVAECLLMQNGEDGSYLMRPSTRRDSLALSVRAHDSVKHYTVSCLNNGKYQFGQITFTSIDDFIQHFYSQPLLAGESGILTLLKYPYPRQVDEPSQYEVIRIQAQMGPQLSLVEPCNLTMGSKEGFLTKRGGRIKSWKIRWFVLKKMELRYYESRIDSEPLRVLDLRQCQECVLVYVLDGHDNCFRMVFPSRTFYCSAATPAEAREWIDLIQWKLKRSSSSSQLHRDTIHPLSPSQLKRCRSESVLDSD